MKYLITDTEEYTLGEINKYFIEELKKTNLNPEDIVIEKSLRVKIAVVEIERIFDENGIEGIKFFPDGTYELKHTGNSFYLPKSELKYRFENAYECLLDGIKGT